MKYSLPLLSYSYSSLEPFIDSKTMETHYSKHHQTYCDKLNEALSKHPEIKEDIIELLKDLSKVPEDIRIAVKNHGGGFVNHNLYWEILTDDSQKREFKGKIADAIKKEFESYDKFKEMLSNASINRFGSGYGWLVLNKDKKLEITSTSNQDSPLSDGKSPLMLIDVWEHAYYLKWLNKRADHVNTIWNVINWKRVDELYQEAMK